MSEGISLRLISYPGKTRMLPTTLNTARDGQRQPGLGIGKAHCGPKGLCVSELKGRLYDADPQPGQSAPSARTRIGACWPSSSLLAAISSPRFCSRLVHALFIGT